MRDTGVIMVHQKKIFNRFKILLAQKEFETGKKIPYSEIKNATGIASSTLSAWATNEIKRYHEDTIAALCEYFGCEVGDLIVYKRTEE
jgi:putative transcriptional regulator